MLGNYVTWHKTPIKGKEEDTPATILDKLDPDAESGTGMWKKYFPFSYLGHDKEGNPLYYEKTG